MGARHCTEGAGGGSQTQMRFMGQRYIPDSRFCKALGTYDRPVPTGLDLFAVFGSGGRMRHFGRILPAQTAMERVSKQF